MISRYDTRPRAKFLIITVQNNGIGRSTPVEHRHIKFSALIQKFTCIMVADSRFKSIINLLIDFKKRITHLPHFSRIEITFLIKTGLPAIPFSEFHHLNHLENNKINIQSFNPFTPSAPSTPFSPFFFTPASRGHKKKEPLRQFPDTRDSLKTAATYSPALRCSTIGASGLNFSVRDGKRWNTGAKAT